ncbi:hypothetical protein N3K66_005097 [Trichothecium roseum]|uniref:Uncharacterized protein n=1 Tax=Trichothecium roseum TaxID=47278 RepID=A0ACC0V368_9HYPO|nr:hypothetical protein N3K66_005097 [Trichothecium roseum]
MASTATDIKDFLQAMVGPWMFMSLSARHMPLTVRQLVSRGDYGTLLSPSAFSSALFGNFWATIGPEVKSSAEARVIPLLEGRIRGGKVVDDVAGVPARGVVVEVGAGSGQWADVFARLHAGGGKGGPEGGIEKIYGIEPNPQSAAALRKRTTELGLEGTYEVVPLGIESLSDDAAWGHGGRAPLRPGSVDCIVSILCLCSIPDPAGNCKRLYDLLRPGGRWYVYEHVVAPRGGLAMRLYQNQSDKASFLAGFVNIFWSFFLGGCLLCRDTKKTLREAGPWSEIDLAQPPTEAAYQVVPHILGTLTK